MGPGSGVRGEGAIGGTRRAKAAPLHIGSPFRTEYAVRRFPQSRRGSVCLATRLWSELQNDRNRGRNVSGNADYRAAPDRRAQVPALRSTVFATHSNWFAVRCSVSDFGICGEHMIYNWVESSRM